MPSTSTTAPNLFTLDGHHLRVTYSTTVASLPPATEGFAPLKVAGLTTCKRN